MLVGVRFINCFYPGSQGSPRCCRPQRWIAETMEDKLEASIPLLLITTPYNISRVVTQLGVFSNILNKMNWAVVQVM